MKRLRIFSVIIASLFLTGCIQEYNVQEEQVVAIAEYTAGLILKYDKGYNEELIQLNAEPEGESENSAPGISGGLPIEDITDTTDASGKSEGDEAGFQEIGEDASLTDLIDKAGLILSYSDFKLVDTYPEDPVSEGIYLGYNEGYQYLVVNFTMKNTTKSKKEINLIKSGINYRLKVNGTKDYEPSLTLLENDLRYLDITIGAGKSKNVLLIFKLPSNTKVDNVDLTATKENKSFTIKLR